MLSWDSEDNVIKICVWTCNMTSRSYFGKMNSTLGSVVPLAMFHIWATPSFLLSATMAFGWLARLWGICHELTCCFVTGKHQFVNLSRISQTRSVKKVREHIICHMMTCSLVTMKHSKCFQFWNLNRNVSCLTTLTEERTWFVSSAKWGTILIVFWRSSTKLRSEAARPAWLSPRTLARPRLSLS